MSSQVRFFGHHRFRQISFSSQQMTQNQSSPPPFEEKGHAKVARLFAKHEEFAILRRFKQLNYQSLLYQQAEIISLEEELLKCAQRDAAHADRKEYETYWWRLAHAKDPEGRQQWETIQILRNKLAEYSKFQEVW